MVHPRSVNRNNNNHSNNSYQSRNKNTNPNNRRKRNSINDNTRRQMNPVHTNSQSNSNLNINKTIRRRKNSGIIARPSVEQSTSKIRRKNRPIKNRLQSLTKRIFRKKKPVSESDLDNEMDNYWTSSNNKDVVGKKLDNDMDDYWKQKYILDQELTGRIDSALKSGRETKVTTGGVVV